MLYFIDQIEDGFDPGEIEAVNGVQVVDAPQGINRLFREFQHPIGWLNDRPYQTGTTIDCNGSAGAACEMCRRIEAVRHAWLQLKQFQCTGWWNVRNHLFAHEDCLCHYILS